MKFDINIFRKSVQSIHVLLKSDKNNGYFLREDQCTFLFIIRSVLLRTRNVSDKSFREIQNTHFMSSNFFFSFFFFRKSCRFLDDAEKYCTAGQATDGNTAHSLCMPDT